MDPPPDLVEAMAAGGLLRSLSELEIICLGPSIPAGPLLRGLTSASRLTRLRLEGVAWDRRAAKHYFAGESAKELRHLALNRTPLGEAEVRDLCGDAMPPLDALEMPRLAGALANLARSRWGSRVNLWWAG